MAFGFMQRVDPRYRTLVGVVLAVGGVAATLGLLMPRPKQFLPAEEAVAVYLGKRARADLTAAKRSSGLPALLSASRAQVALRLLLEAGVTGRTADRILGSKTSALQSDIMTAADAALAGMPELSKADRTTALRNFSLGDPVA